ncbi:MAG: twin-arginine translocase TatA/TatE family subunit [Deltaproteobacteria bacterium]|nr:twin-arginine translocase TatA/TatE family subunit [Deltaproteobacteria bacterium]
MFGLGVYELLFILVIALIVFGPGKLPQIGSGLGKAIHDFRNAMSGEGSKRNGEGGKGMTKKDSEEPPR